MPLQNRVTPFGDIVAIPQRGMFTGNRGIIHDPATRTLLNRRWTSKAWLVCVCEFKGRRRTVMASRSWTELFFLDEAIALAAGHRPCFFCRRDAAEAFRDAWAFGRAVRCLGLRKSTRSCTRNGSSTGASGCIALTARPDELPDGAVIAAAGEPYTLAHGRAFRWTARGYEGPVEIPRCRRAAHPTFDAGSASCRLSAGAAPEY